MSETPILDASKRYKDALADACSAARNVRNAQRFLSEAHAAASKAGTELHQARRAFIVSLGIDPEPNVITPGRTATAFETLAKSLIEEEAKALKETGEP